MMRGKVIRMNKKLSILPKNNIIPNIKTTKRINITNKKYDTLFKFINEYKIELEKETQKMIKIRENIIKKIYEVI